MTVPLVRRSGFTLIELLVVIAIIGTLASFVMPAIRRALEEGNKARCASNLKGIYTLALLYSQKERVFPVGEGKNAAAHASLQKLIDDSPEDFAPELFVCDSGEATRAPTERDGRFVLDADTNGYAWVARRTKSTARNRPILADKYFEGYEDAAGAHSGHPRGVNVASTDGSVVFWSTERLDDSGLPPGLVR